MKTKNLLMLLAVVGILIFASCKKDETPAPLTKAEAEVALTSIEQNYSTDIDGFEASEANQVMNIAENLGLTFENGLAKAPINKESFQKTATAFFAQDSSGEDLLDFDFENNVGTWNKVNGQWVKTPNQTDKIVVIFSYKGGVNNGKLTYYDYAKKTIPYSEGNETYISNLSSMVEIVGMANPVATRKYTGNLSYSLSSMNMSFKFEYTLGAYSKTNSFSLEGNKYGGVVSALDEIKKSGEILKSTSFTMTLKDQGVLIVNANFRIKDIIIKWVVTINNTTNLNGNPGSYQNISVWTTDGAKVADVVFISQNSSWIPYFKFVDDSEIKVAEYFSGSLWGEILSFNNSLLFFHN